MTFGLVAGTTLIALPVHTQLRLRLKRRFESSDLNAEALIGSETGSTITVGSPVELCREMASRIAAFLGTNSVRVFFRSPETDDWMAADSVASPPSGPLIEACRPLLNVIAERGEDVVRDVMDDDLLATEHERSIVNAMHALGASLAIPLTVSGDVWGVLAVGDKNTATNYTVGEIRSLRRLARELALGLYRAHVAFGVGSPPRRGVPLSNLFPRPPERIGPYDVERLLGEGGMALVYLATRDGRQVAVKVLNDRARQSLKLERRFQRECEILREIHHPNVLGVIDFSPRPEPYLVLEYCPLGTVRDRLRHESRLDVAEALRIARQAAQGLRAAHEMGVVHRDVNPRNLLRADEDLIKVADFGIAHWDREVALTTHELLGTPGYFSPEVCEGRSVDWRADQYALGITLFEMLAGRRPYGAPRPLEVLAMHVHAPVPDLRVELPGLEDRVAETAKAMMSKDPSDRFESYDALIEELDRCDSNAV